MHISYNANSNNWPPITHGWEKQQLTTSQISLFLLFFIQAADTKDTCQCCELVGEMKGKYVTPSGPGNKFLFMICIGMNVIPHGKESESQ